MTVSIAVLASGRGSNFSAILDAIGAGRLDARVVALVTDRPDARALELARARDIPVVLADSRDRDARDAMILQGLEPLLPRFLVMAGYMRLVTPRLLEAFRSERGYTRVVNVHPSLLPAFPGVNSYGQAFRHGAHLTGVTVHLVEEEVDSGPICVQESFPIRDCRSPEEVEARGLEIEHRLYPETLAWVLPEKFEIEMRTPVRRFCVRPN